MSKRKWVFISAIGLLAMLLGQGIYADFRAGYYNPAGLETMHQTLPASASTDSTYDAGQYPIYYPELAAGDGKEDVENNCELCHSPRYITMQPPMSAQAWAAEVSKMRNIYGASIPDATAQKIIKNLGTHYTPETRKR
jgi:hypothetical protein